MDQPLYDIYFSGQLIEGTSPESARAKLAELFKSSPDTIARIFNGKAQALKRGVNRADALTYKAAFHRAGLIVNVKAQQSTVPKTLTVSAQQTEIPTASSPATSNQAPTGQAPTTHPDHQITSTARAGNPEHGDWSVAPSGSNVLKEHERKKPVSRDIDTSAIQMVSVFFEPQAAITETVAAPDVRHLSVAPVGEDILVDKHNPSIQQPVDIHDLTLAPVGSVIEILAETNTPLDPDTSYLSLAETGANLLEGQRHNPPPPAPAVDHLSIDKD